MGEEAYTKEEFEAINEVKPSDMPYAEVARVHQQTADKLFKAMHEKEVESKLVGVRFLFLDETGMLQTVGSFSKGFDPEDYEQ